MPTSTEVAIATTTLSTSSATITFNSIPSTYTDLKLVLCTTGLSESEYVYLQYNGDGYPSQNFSSVHLYGGGASAGSFRWTNAYGIYAHGIGAIGTTPNVLITADIFYYQSSNYKSCLISYSTDNNGSGYVGRAAGLWRSTSAINSVNVRTSSTAGTSYFNVGTTATLYGIL